MIFFILSASWTDLGNSGKSAINASAILDTGFASRLAFSPLPITPFTPRFPRERATGDEAGGTQQWYAAILDFLRY